MLTGKFVVIAGASQGIGQAISTLFASEGAHVIMLARNVSKLQQAAIHITEAGGKATAYPMDVSVSENWNQLAHWLREKQFSCDILINNAYWRTLVTIGSVSDEDWNRTIQVSLASYFYAARAMIPFMLERKSGSIINISSLQSRVPEPCFGAYAVAKGGVEALTRVIARDYGPEIRSNTIVSGAVDTPGFAEGDEVKHELGRRLPLGRIGNGEEIAQTALFLASGMSSFITGTEIVSDGGRAIT